MFKQSMAAVVGLAAALFIGNATAVNRTGGTGPDTGSAYLGDYYPDPNTGWPTPLDPMDPTLPPKQWHCTYAAPDPQAMGWATLVQSMPCAPSIYRMGATWWLDSANFW